MLDTNATCGPMGRRSRYGEQDGLASCPVVAKLERLSTFTDESRAALYKLAMHTKTPYAARTDLYRDGQQTAGIRFLLSGVACDYVLLPDGRRQVISLLLPGDEIIIHGSAKDFPIRNICMLTDTVISEISPATARAATQHYPEFGDALWRSSIIADAIRQERIVNLGRRSAKERLAHLFCEIFFRSQTVGLANGWKCAMPLTQSDLGDTLGLSLVHVNRSLQLLRGENLLQLEQRTLHILDLAGLQNSSHFDPHYLSISKEAARVAPFGVANWANFSGAHAGEA